jgi:hypothetical protein
MKTYTAVEINLHIFPISALFPAALPIITGG